jgi:hypothetical protein
MAQQGYTGMDLSKAAPRRRYEEWLQAHPGVC